MLGLVVCQPSEMVNHFFPAPPSPPAKPPDRDKLNADWLGSSSFGDRPTIQPRLCARNHIQPRPSTRSKKPHGLSRPCCLIMTLTVNLFFILACVSTAGAIRSEPDIANPNYPYLNSLATSETIGKLYLKLDTLSIDYVVPISEIEETIDFLSLKVATMKYASSLEKLRPITLMSGGIIYTMFQVPMSLHMASSICKNFMLTPLTITDLSPYFKAPFPGFSLILNFEIVTRNDRLTCILKGVIIPEQRCLDEIQHVTQPDIDFPVQQDLKRAIIKNTTSGSTYIVLDNDKFRLTSSPFGTSACAGQIAVSTSDNLKRLHDHFFSKMADVFVHIFDIIELTA
jgi:hypothetical protein